LISRKTARFAGTFSGKESRRTACGDTSAPFSFTHYFVFKNSRKNIHSTTLRSYFFRLSCRNASSVGISALFLFTFYPDKKEKTGEMSVPLRFTNTSPVLVTKLYFVLL